MMLEISQFIRDAISRVNTNQLLIVFVPPALILLVLVAVSVALGISPPMISRDVAAIAKIHPLAGILSSLGMILWSAAAAICLFSAMIVRSHNQTESFRFLLCSFFLTTYLLIDDLFQFHEALAPIYLGLSEKIVYAFLGCALLIYLAAFSRLILRTKFIFLLLAFGLLGASVAIDAVIGKWLWPLGIYRFFIEDGAKWLGIASYCAYYVEASRQLLQASPSPD